MPDLPYNFRAGHGLSFFDPSLIKERISLSQGTLHLSTLEGYQKLKQNYQSNAFIPMPIWHEPDSQAHEVLQANAAGKPQSIMIQRMEPALISQLKALGVGQIKSLKDINDLQNSRPADYEKIMALLSQYVKQFNGQGKALHSFGFHLGNPNQLTTTINGESSLKTGLHIDLWDKKSLVEVSDATNRISINLGNEARYLLYVNLTVDQLLEDIALPEDRDPSSLSQAELTQSFFINNPTYPVIKIRLDPFESYIAPTEGLIHDGSTQGTHNLDLTYVVRGWLSSAQI